MPPLNALKVFEAAARRESIAKAAGELSLRLELLSPDRPSRQAAQPIDWLVADAAAKGTA
jgi:hypothetical protein